MNQPAAESKDTSEDVPGTADEFPAIANWGTVNKSGTADYMAWATMVKKEFQDQLNDDENLI